MISDVYFRDGDMMTWQREEGSFPLFFSPDQRCRVSQQQGVGPQRMVFQFDLIFSLRKIN